MKKNKRTPLPLQLSVLLFVLQLLISPVALIAQTRADEAEAAAIKRRQDEAATQLAEANARKAAADADKAQSDIAKQELDMRKTQLDMLKSTSTVEGSLVENNIATYKALQCVADDVSTEINDSDASYLILYNAQTANNYSGYVALRSQIVHANAGYPDAIQAVLAKIKSYYASEEATLTAAIKTLDEELAELDRKIAAEKDKKKLEALKADRESKETLKKWLEDRDKNLESWQFGLSETITGVAELRSTAFSNLSAKGGSLINLISGLGLGAATGGPIGAIVSGALGTLALFKTDTTLKGTDVKVGAPELVGYLRSRIKDGIKIISPDNIVLNDTVENSALLELLLRLSVHYSIGKRTMTLVADAKKDVIKFAEKTNRKKDAVDNVNEKTAELEIALKTYAADPNNAVLKLNYQRTQAALEKAQTELDQIQKKIDKAGSDFDEDLSEAVAVLDAHNVLAESISKRLSGVSTGTGTDKDTASQPLLGDYLRAELLYNTLHPTGPTPEIYWFDFNIAASGANQMTKSSVLFDIFTRGPMRSFSGASVVSFRLIKPSGEIKSANTVWAYAPYRKSSNINKYECRKLDSGTGGQSNKKKANAGDDEKGN